MLKNQGSQVPRWHRSTAWYAGRHPWHERWLLVHRPRPGGQGDAGRHGTAVRRPAPRRM